MDPNVIVSLITDLGSFGFILYLVHRTQTHTIPKLVSTYDGAIGKQREDFKMILVSQRQDFQIMLEKQQQMDERIFDAVMSEVRHLSDEVRRNDRVN